MNRFAKFGFLVAVLAIASFSAPVLAADFNRDLSISASEVKVSDNILKGQTARIYVTVRNNSKYDLSGVVKFYDDRVGAYLGSDQPISALAGKTDDVFVDFSSEVTGEHSISIRILPWSEAGNDPSNDKVTKILFVDTDPDSDGQGNRLDPDDDNDGVPDSRDAFPLDPRESADADHDGLGDNADPDDDNDGVPDAQDAFPLDPTESKDSDQDGAGDTKDAFPYDPKDWQDTDRDGKGDNTDLQPQNAAPIPQILRPDSNSEVGTPLTFNALKSTDPDDTISSYKWDFGDGTETTGVLVDHRFKKPGTYLVKLTLTDSRGETSTQEAQVIVKRGWILPSLIGVTGLLILMIAGMLIPGSKFHHKKMFARKSKIRHTKR